jgi:hypothetical protein
VHQPDQKEIGYGRTEQPKDKVGSPPSVKYDGEQQDDIISEPLRTHEIAYQEKGQEIE